MWISAAIRSLEFLSFPEIFKNSSLLETHTVDRKTLQNSFSERIKTTSELYASVEVPKYCQVSWDNNDVLKINFHFSDHPDRNFAKNDDDSYQVIVPINDIIDRGYDIAVKNLQVNVQGLFFFDPIASYAKTLPLAKELAMSQLFTSYVQVKDLGNKSNRSLILPCISAAQ